MSIVHNTKQFIDTLIEAEKSNPNDELEFGSKPAFRDIKTFGYLVDKFNDLTGFSTASGNGAGSHVVVPGEGPNGESIIRMTLGSTGPYRLNKNIILPVARFTTRSGYFVQPIRVNDESLITQLCQFFFLTGGSQYYQKFTNIRLAADKNEIQPNEWFYIVFSGGEMAAAGGAAAFASNTLDTASIRWGIQSGLSGGVVDFGPLWYAEKQTKPVVTFSFDDSNKTDITHAKPILDRYGFRATTHTIAADVGGTNKLTVADLHALYNAGWDVGVHGSYSHADTLITKSAIYADVKMNQDFLVANGLPRSTSYAYPEGDFLPASIQVMRELGFKCAGSVHATPMPINFQNPLRYSRSGTSGKTAAALKLEVDSVITRSGALDFFTHGLYGSGGIHTTEDIFEELVEYVAEKHEAGQLEGGFTMGEYIR